MSADPSLSVSVFGSLREISEEDWDSCANPSKTARPADPFTTHRFLSALENSDSVGDGTGWYPRYLRADENGAILGVAPAYAKTHSQGEYIFDHAWAHAYSKAGGRYYPKLQIAVPFTPVSGRRLLVRELNDTKAQDALLEGARLFAGQIGCTSVQMTFCSETEYTAGARGGYLQRQTQQFHWYNHDYACFDDFLERLSSRKRKTIRKERRIAQAFGGEITRLTGDAIKPHHWDAFWRFYQDTGARKWGTPYLTRAFFDEIHKTMRDDVLLVLATRNGREVAAALNFIGRDALYGRYWGCTEAFPCLHFEICYYQAIEFAIENGLARIEAGAQGEHKLARGYLPAPTYSLHWFEDPNFAEAISQYLDHEKRAVDEEMEILTQYGPFKKPSEAALLQEQD